MMDYDDKVTVLALVWAIMLSGAGVMFWQMLVVDAWHWWLG